MGASLDELNDLMALYAQPDSPAPAAAPGYRQALPLLRETFAEIAAETAVPVEGSVDSFGLVKFVAARLHFSDVSAGGGIGLSTVFPAGTMIADINVFGEVTFDDATSNVIVFASTGDLVSASPFTVPFARCDDLTQTGGRPVTGVDSFGVEQPQFTPVYSAAPLRVIAGFTGTAPTQGQALIVYTIATT